MSEYNRKRNFTITSEPREESVKEARKAPGSLRFVIQKHDASHLHYDFRLELDGTLKSWAIPKGPSLDPQDKRLAVHVEDHPLGYATFEGSIPEGQYGAGDVIVWDQGVWQPHGDPQETYKSGKLKFALIGEKLSGEWALVRTRLKGSGDKEQWLLIKERDDVARPASEYNVVDELPNSVISGAAVGQGRAGKKAPAAKAKLAHGQATKVKTRKPAANQAHTAIPDTLKPQLATLVTEAPSGDWVYEIKFDGYRMLARIKDGEVKLFTRNGHDWSARLPEQIKALQALKLQDSWLDGEAVVLNDDGMPDFQGLQNAFDEGASQQILYYLFDAPFLNGEDLRQTPLQDRREALKKALKGVGKRAPLRFSDAFSAAHQDLVTSACAMGLEGVIGKRLGSTYVSRRSDDWIKLKCRHRQEMVIVGYSAPKGSRSGFGALLVAVHEDGKLRYAGRVGTGFDAKRLEHLMAQMKPLEQDKSPLDKAVTSAQARGVQWLQPKLVCEVEFAEWTREGVVRQASFIAQRTDKPAGQITQEKAVQPPAAKATAKRKASSGKNPREELDKVSISHPERVIDAQSGTQKIELAQFYHDIGEWVMPHLRGRPVSLLRAPDGVEGQQFFQKHAEHLAIPNITHLDQKLDPGHARLMQIDSLAALIGAVQMGCIELHTWGAITAAIDKPDRMILDLDPDPALPWRSMVEATKLTLAVLDEVGLDAWLKTSGGKGMHIVVPLSKHASWDTVKAFAKALATFMTKQIPERFIDKMGPQNRIGKIFIDYLRNGRGASTASAYSVRARPGLPVSVPISRDELDGLKSAAQWTVDNLRERLDSLKQDPWHDYHNRQRITAAHWKKLGAKPV